MAGSRPAQYGHEVVTEAYEGRRGARMWFSAARKPGGFGTLMQMFRPGTFAGRRLRFSAAVRTKDVRDWAGLWMRVDGEGRGGHLAFDNMQDRPLKGTTDWARHEVVLDVAPEATAVAFGLLISGRGEAWLADVRFEPVGLDVPTTGGGGRPLPDGPANLDFSEDEAG